MVCSHCAFTRVHIICSFAEYTDWRKAIYFTEDSSKNFTNFFYMKQVNDLYLIPTCQTAHLLCICISWRKECLQDVIFFELSQIYQVVISRIGKIQNDGRTRLMTLILQYFFGPVRPRNTVPVRLGYNALLSILVYLQYIVTTHFGYSFNKSMLGSRF